MKSSRIFSCYFGLSYRLIGTQYYHVPTLSIPTYIPGVEATPPLFLSLSLFFFGIGMGIPCWRTRDLTNPFFS